MTINGFGVDKGEDCPADFLANPVIIHDLEV